MLENLPAKRVCKQIFPLDIKKKKKKKVQQKQQQQNQRRKLLVKRSFVLRQTRARQQQIAKTGKKLTKIRNKKQQQITKNVAVKTVTQSKRNLRLRNLKKHKQQQENKRSTATTTTSNTSKKNDSGEERRSRSLTPKHQEMNKSATTEHKKIATTTDTIENKIISPILTDVATTTIGATTKATLVSTAAITTTTTTIITMNEMFEYANSNASSTSTCTTNTLNSAASVPTTTTTIGAITTRKRSKRISDCIAMLTGKLEEKLKTEQQPTTTTTIQTRSIVANNFNSNSNNNNNNNVATAEQIQMHGKEQKIDVEQVKCIIKPQTPPKTPKRKAQSRRILKPPSCTPAPAPPTSLMASPLLQPPISASSVTKTTALISIVPQTPTIVATKMPTSILTTSSLTTAPSLPAHLMKPAITTNMPVISLTAIPTLVNAATPLQMGNNMLQQKLPTNYPMGLLPTHITTPNNNNNNNNNNNKKKKNMATTLTVATTTTPLSSVMSNNYTRNKLPLMSNINLQTLPLSLTHSTMPLNPVTITTLQMLPHNINIEEPLNLSSNAAKHANDSLCGIQRSIAMTPTTYRNNMYGIDMTQHNMFHNDEMGPLDLSVKPNKNHKNFTTNALNAKEITASSIANIMPLALTVTTTNSMTMPSNQPLALTVSNKKLFTAPTTTTTMLLNDKHFYSNLDLLKIPQVRSQLATFAATTTTTTTVTSSSTTTTATMSNIFDNNTFVATSCGHVLQGATKATMIVAPIVKKRGNNRQQQCLYDANTTTSTTFSTMPQLTTTTTPTTRIIRLYPNKKEHQLTMNEEVINHIDDAINSVINAVKASLTPERADDELEKQVTTIIPITTTTTAVATLTTNILTTIATINPITTITTTTNFLPVFSYANTIATTTTTAAITQPPLAPIMPIKRRGRSKAIEQPLPAATTPIMHSSMSATEVVVPLPTIASTIQLTATTTTTNKNNNLTQMSTTTTNKKIKTRSNLCLVEDIRIEDEQIKTSVFVPTTTSTTIIPTNSEQQQNQIQSKLKEIFTTLAAETASTNIATTTTTKIATIEKEQGKKEEEAKDEKVNKSTDSIPTTTTTSINDKELENVGDQPKPAQKKCRRRRKNELAAIVADQLLESFKIDKARRDSLKKLENLAYEHKSDDLFMTGMLLMSSTKRSVTMNNAQKQQQQQQQQQTNDIEQNTTTKRSSLRTRQTTNNTTTTTTTTKTTTTAKRGRRAGSGGGGRRRGGAKTLDNKNIIKLKSSLESFSIGIERQLTEFEAKKEQLQQHRLNEGNAKEDLESKTGNNKNSTTIKTTSASILRPSILSASIESMPAPLTAENVAKVTSSLAKEQSRSGFASRDPRLNKNIHKETDDDKQLKQPDAACDYEEEDNYLTEIAKNVNEKIMAEENEDFMFPHDGLLELEDTSSQFYSRPATAMSVRSAPNFDDRSDFGSMCGDDDDDDDEEHTNTEVMDMDLDDEMSVYTSYSQDLGRGSSARRRRRRRRSILLTRRPKKRMQRNENEAEKFECTLCKKIFFSATSLSKHNMTLAHVSKVSEQEYLLSKASLLEQTSAANVLNEFPSLPKPTTTRRAKTPTPNTRRAKTPTATTSTNRGRKSQVKIFEDLVPAKITTLLQDKEQNANKNKSNCTAIAPQTTEQIGFGATSSHLALNSDERLFFECCTILKGTQDEQENSTHKHEDSNNFSPYQYHLNNKIIAESKKSEENANKSSNVENATRSNKKHSKSMAIFRDPSDYNKNEK